MLGYFYFRWHKIINIFVSVWYLSLGKLLSICLWMILKKELSLNDSKLKEGFGLSCWSRFHLSFSLLFAIWVSLHVFCHALISWMNKKLRVTSPLLKVIAGWEGSHWVLTTLPFIRKLYPHPIQWEWGNVGVFYELLGVWIFPFIPPHLARVYLWHTSF